MIPINFYPCPLGIMLRQLLVTKEEPSWESFSEDETPVPKVTTTASTAATGKLRKTGGKQGQGNIMSFFGHK